MNPYMQNNGQNSNQQILVPPQNLPPLNNQPMVMQPYPPINNPQGMYPPPPPQNQMPPELFPGLQFVYVIDPLAELANCTGVEIRQQPEFFEMMTGCETANRYHVFGQTPQGIKYLFKCNEQSGWLMRNCCPSDMRQFNMNIVHVTSTSPMSPQLSKSFANAFKPFKCTICCLNRPELFLTLNDDNRRVGVIKNPFSLCDPIFDVIDEHGTLKYIVTADCCQCGLVCANNLFGKMSEATFNILNPSNNQVLGTIIKKPANFNEMVTDADSYQINFPVSAPPTDKLLIIAIGLMIDYQYFETNNSSDEQHRRGRRRYHRRY